MTTQSIARNLGVAATWGITALLALFWTGGAWVAALLVEWAAGAIASGAALEAGRTAVTLPVPAWLAFWFDPAFLQALQSALAWALENAQQALPFLGAAAGWLVPLVWVAWGVGLVLLLATAGGVHLLLRRLAPRTG